MTGMQQQCYFDITFLSFKEICIIIIYKMTNYDCIKCGFKSKQKTDYLRHIATKKHLQISAMKKEKDFVEYSCKSCNYTSTNKTDYNRHLNTNKHMKNTKEYICTTCNYNTTKKTDYDKHLLTQKHKDNKSGIKGIFWYARDKKWMVKFSVNGKSKSFGTYFDIEVAKFVVQAMRCKYHGNFANHG